MEACLARIIEQWNALQLFFTNAVFEENIVSAGPILDFLNSKEQKCLMLFLNFILPKINTVNKFFQRKDTILHKIKRVLHSFFKEICSLFLQPNYILNNNPSDIDPLNQEQLLDLNLINLGNAVNTFINSPDTPDFNIAHKMNIKSACLEYLQQLCIQIKNRFNNMQNNFFDSLECMSPANALSPNFHQNNNNIIKSVIEQFRVLLDNENDLNSLIDEWNLIIFHDFEDNAINANVEINQFWFNLYFYPNEAGEFPFRNLANSFLPICIVPHSNAEPERVWSKLKLEKTPLRNKLSVDTINGLLLASDHIKQTGDCRNFEPTEIMLQLINNVYDELAPLHEEE